MKYIDSHCHLHDERIQGDIPGILARAEEAGVRYMVSCATMESNFKRTRSLSREYGSILPCYGIHPWFLDSLSDRWEQVLGEQAAPEPCAIGETGLDFMDKAADRDKQIRVFRFHLELANTLGRPVNIHIRKAWDALIQILKKSGPLKTPGLIHSYSGSADLIPVLEKFNLYISFSGSVTRPNAKKVVKAVRAVSKDRILLETDAPDIYPSLDEPAGSTPRLNEPANLVPIAGAAARIRGMNVEELAETAYDNSLKIFSPVLP
ncbi:TatD family hydrolase [Desulfospira joergensenii]|uniref:TatD family hydrolase n=1 Tax=Desulfospira joergensenii TaxID=53329 RepID=UPI0003B2E204|nr:TatD family hydrolase [Desulfospira joergensenii]